MKYKFYEGTINEGKFPKILYKYRNWDFDFHNRFIINKEIFMSPASSFKDAMDCKIPVRYDLLKHSQSREFYIRLLKKKQSDLLRNQYRESARIWLKKNLLKDKKYIDEYNKYYFDEIDSRTGILCLTEFPCLNRMWIDYANTYEGFCIGYNSNVLFNFLGGGGNVIYGDLPVIYPQPIMEFHEIQHKQIYFKESIWSHENEYRTHIFSELPLTLQARQIKLPKEAFNCVILGKNISKKNRVEITIAVKENIGEIPILEYNNIC